jgi:hypothetical protein
MQLSLDSNDVVDERLSPKSESVDNSNVEHQQPRALSFPDPVSLSFCFGFLVFVSF